jgi:hypothetical protein
VRLNLRLLRPADYAAFNVDVTTNPVPAGANPATYVRVMIGGSNTGVLGINSGGGVAYVSAARSHVRCARQAAASEACSDWQVLVDIAASCSCCRGRFAASQTVFSSVMQRTLLCKLPNSTRRRFSCRRTSEQDMLLMLTPASLLPADEHFWKGGCLLPASLCVCRKQRPKLA